MGWPVAPTAEHPLEGRPLAKLAKGASGKIRSRKTQNCRGPTNTCFPPCKSCHAAEKMNAADGLAVKETSQSVAIHDTHCPCSVVPAHLRGADQLWTPAASRWVLRAGTPLKDTLCLGDAEFSVQW